MRLPVARPILRPESFRDVETSSAHMSKRCFTRGSITGNGAISNLCCRAVTQHIGWLRSPTSPRSSRCRTGNVGSWCTAKLRGEWLEERIARGGEENQECFKRVKKELR
jgi:hypothetical protein